jgi:curved DNA-binding protein CbpA
LFFTGILEKALTSLISQHDPVQDYYHILGLPQTATAAQIRAAFKRLAMQYHPDRNPNNPIAEEIFKQVNEAYHILSDPLKKSRYDSRFYTYETQSATHAAEEYAREMRRRQHQARRPYAQRTEKTYTITGNYFKVQGLAFLVFLVLSGISFGIVHLASFLFDRYEARIHHENILKAQEANTLFGAGKIDEAIGLINQLTKNAPMEFVFRDTRDSLIEEVGRMGGVNFTNRNYERALHYFQYYKKYQERGQSETLELIYICQFNIGQYHEALQSLKQLHSEKPWSLELIYRIATLNLDHLNNQQEAMFYLDLGEKTFRSNMTDIYGEAFMIMLDPKDIPDRYYEIFILKADTEISLNNYKEAEPDLELAIYLRPERPEGYRSRAILNGLRQKYQSACADLRKAKTLGANGIEELQAKYCR